MCQAGATGTPATFKPLFDMEQYAFVVKNRQVIIDACDYQNALSRILFKYPNKYVNTKYAKRMDLINAQKNAKEQSKLQKGQLIYVILEQDEFEVRDFMKIKDTDDVYSIWRDGAKIDSPNGKKEVETKTENKMAKTAKKVAPKKAAKKVAVKKVAAPKKEKVAKVNGSKRVFEPGKLVDISIADMRSNMKKGFFYRDPQGVRQTESYMSTRQKQDHVRTGMHEYKEVKE